MSKKRVRRKLINLSVEKPMQKRLIFWVFAIALCCLILAGAGFYIYSDQSLGKTFKQAHFKVKSMKEMLFPVVLVILAAALAAAFTLSLFFPLHIAGPVYRIKSYIKGIAEGDLSGRIQLRRRDELHDLARELNRMVSELNARITELQSESTRLHILAKDAAEGRKAEGATKPLDEILKCSERLEKGLRWFRTEAP